MKKVLMASLLALGVMVACEQKALAWKDVHFSCGISFSAVGGDNSYLWGLYRSGPYPGTVSGLPSYTVVPQYATAPCYGGAPYGNYGGYAAMPGADAYAGYAAQAPATQAAPAAAANPQTYSAYYNTGYQPVGYYYSGYSNYQVPSYWYGR